MLSQTSTTMIHVTSSSSHRYVYVTGGYICTRNDNGVDVAASFERADVALRNRRRIKRWPHRPDVEVVRLEIAVRETPRPMRWLAIARRN